MGREVKRVALDFDWPLHKVWAGFLNPFYAAESCEHCDGSGYTPEAKRLSDQWYGYAAFHPSETGSTLLTTDTPAVRAFVDRQMAGSPEFYGKGEANAQREGKRLCDMWNTQWGHHLDADDVAALLAEGRLEDFTRQGIENPTPEQVNAWNILTMGHDAINQSICVRAKAKRLGYEIECPYCHGDGVIWPNKASKDLYEAWKDIEPPTGDGWQLWETTSEGSPISPVFDTAEGLIEWMANDGYSRDGATAFVKGTGWAPTFMMTPRHGLQSGVDAAGDL